MQNQPSNASASSQPRTHRQLRILRQRDHAPALTKGEGVRRDVTWTRDGEKPRCSNVDLIDAVEWLHSRRGAPMSTGDASTLAELERRSWGFREAVACHLRALPAWVVELLPSRRGRGFGEFVGLVISAYRAGAIGIWASYSEIMALISVGSSDTWRRWSAEMEDLGLIRIVQTHTTDPADHSRRITGVQLYVLGPVLADNKATLERAVNEKSPEAKDARIAAIEARNKARKAVDERRSFFCARRAPHMDSTRRGSPAWKEPGAKKLPQVDEDTKTNLDGVVDSSDNRAGYQAVGEAIGNHSFNCASKIEALSAPLRGGEVPRPLPPSGERPFQKKGQPSRVDHARPVAVRPVGTSPKPRPAPVKRPTPIREVTAAPASNEAMPVSDFAAERVQVAAKEALERISEPLVRSGILDHENRTSEERRAHAQAELAKQRSAYSSERIAEVMAALAAPPEPIDFSVLEGISDLTRLWLRLGIAPEELARRAEMSLDQARRLVRAHRQGGGQSMGRRDNFDA